MFIDIHKYELLKSKPEKLEYLASSGIDDAEGYRKGLEKWIEIWDNEEVRKRYFSGDELDTGE